MWFHKIRLHQGINVCTVGYRKHQLTLNVQNISWLVLSVKMELNIKPPFIDFGFI